jgi:hypothetical protein
VIFLKYTANSHSAVGDVLQEGGDVGRLLTAETLESDMSESDMTEMSERDFIYMKVREVRR